MDAPAVIGVYSQLCTYIDNSLFNTKRETVPEKFTD